MVEIHETAIVEDGAQLGEGVKIGPFCIVGSEAKLDAGVELLSHVIVTGDTTVGEGTRIFPFASIGHQPQDLKFRGEKSRLEIGKNNVIREHVTMNPGTEGDNLLTKVGDNCLVMIGAHVAHDVMIGDNVILVNNVTLGGHVHVGDFAIVGGLSAVHQWVHIGQHAMIGGMSAVENNVIPYGSVVGNRAHLGGLNIVGLKRRGFSREEIHDLRAAYRLLFAEEGTLGERLKDVDKMFPSSRAVRDIIDFIRDDSMNRALCTPRTT